MIVFMNKSGRIVRITCSFYPDPNPHPSKGAPVPAGGGSSSLSADELVKELLEKLPRSEFLRGPFLGNDMPPKD